MLTRSKCGFPASKSNPESSEYALRRGSHRWRCRPSTHFEAKIAKISPPTGSQKWSNRTCGGAVRVVVGHVSTWAMGGHVDATLGVRTGRLWVVLTISPHKYVLSGACDRTGHGFGLWDPSHGTARPPGLLGRPGRISAPRRRAAPPACSRSARPAQTTAWTSRSPPRSVPPSPGWRRCSPRRRSAPPRDSPQRKNATRQVSSGVGCPARNRTLNLQIQKLALCQLSYRANGLRGWNGASLQP